MNNKKLANSHQIKTPPKCSRRKLAAFYGANNFNVIVEPMTNTLDLFSLFSKILFIKECIKMDHSLLLCFWKSYIEKFFTSLWQRHDNPVKILTHTWNYFSDVALINNNFALK